MSKENMKLWDSVCKTDPSQTKKVSLGARKYTAICPQSQRKAATEQFGPYGQGWGVREESFEVVEMPHSPPMLVYRATLWYFTDDKIDGEFPIVSSMIMMSKIKGTSDYRVDDEVYKKVATDALTKGLSFLGFNADVFLGLFDDNRYVQERQQEEKKAKEAEVMATQEEVERFKAKAEEYYKICEEKDLANYEIDPEVLFLLDEKKEIGFLTLKNEGMNMKKYMIALGAIDGNS